MLSAASPCSDPAQHTAQRKWMQGGWRQHAAAAASRLASGTLQVPHLQPLPRRARVSAVHKPPRASSSSVRQLQCSLQGAGLVGHRCQAGGRVLPSCRGCKGQYDKALLAALQLPRPMQLAMHLAALQHAGVPRRPHPPGLLLPPLNEAASHDCYWLGCAALLQAGQGRLPEGLGPITRDMAFTANA